MYRSSTPPPSYISSERDAADALYRMGHERHSAGEEVGIRIRPPPYSLTEDPSHHSPHDSNTLGADAQAQEVKQRARIAYRQAFVAFMVLCIAMLISAYSSTRADGVAEHGVATGATGSVLTTYGPETHQKTTRIPRNFIRGDSPASPRCGLSYLGTDFVDTWIYEHDGHLSLGKGLTASCNSPSAEANWECQIDRAVLYSNDLSDRKLICGNDLAAGSDCKLEDPLRATYPDPIFYAYDGSLVVSQWLEARCERSDWRKRWECRLL